MKLKITKANRKVIQAVNPGDDLSKHNASRDEALNELLAFSMHAAQNSAGVLELDEMTAALLQATGVVYSGDLNQLANLLMCIGLTEILTGNLQGKSQEEITEMVGSGLSFTNDDLEDLLAQASDEV